MTFSEKKFTYGPVYVVRGKHKGRIGNLDDDTIHRKAVHGIVKFAHPLISPGYSLIPMEYLQPPDTQQLIKRHNDLMTLLSPYTGIEVEGQERITTLEEFSYVTDLLSERMFAAQFERSPRGAQIFISHSSADKRFVRGLAVDLAALGHQPWLDEWEILVGESIPERIGAGIDDADFLIVVLSDSAVKSRWVENEWQAKYWTEANERRVTVLPLLLNDCQIPTLLRTKKYVDFRDDYSDALKILTKSIGRHLEKSTDN